MFRKHDIGKAIKAHALTSWSKSLAAALIVIVLIAVQQSEMGTFIENNSAHNLEFVARKFLKKEPTLDPRLNIFIVDDPTIAKIDDRDLPLSRWADVFEYFAANKPAAIFIDRFFKDPIEKEYSAAFVQRAKALGVPIVIGSFTVPAPIDGDKPLGLIPDHNLYNLVKRGKESAESERIEDIE